MIFRRWHGQEGPWGPRETGPGFAEDQWAWAMVASGLMWLVCGTLGDTWAGGLFVESMGGAEATNLEAVAVCSDAAVLAQKA